MLKVERIEQIPASARETIGAVATPEEVTRVRHYYRVSQIEPIPKLSFIASLLFVYRR